MYDADNYLPTIKIAAHPLLDRCELMKSTIAVSILRSSK
jgi:hypothetical protein